ncbi:MAG: hypothetical protein K0R18_485 [Bacillales bacterium]|jgi:hypothetical protein|nr:hypothetical protein [Bacillales bacterium]
MKHLIHSTDSKHIEFYDGQIKIIKSLFNNTNINARTDLTKFGVHFKYKMCKSVWYTEFSKEERKKRADILTSLGNVETKNKKKS